MLKFNFFIPTEIPDFEIKQVEKTKKDVEKFIKIKDFLNFLIEESEAKIKVISLLILLLEEDGKTLKFSIKELRTNYFPHMAYDSIRTSIDEFLKKGILTKDPNNRFKYTLKADFLKK